MTETIHEKAIRLIDTDRVSIRFHGNHVVDADVTGDHGLYAVVIYVGDSFRCWCPATGDCSHVLAVLAVALQHTTGLVPAWWLGPA